MSLVHFDNSSKVLESIKIEDIVMLLYFRNILSSQTELMLVIIEAKVSWILLLLLSLLI